MDGSGVGVRVALARQVIIGIDAGTHSCGFACIDMQGRLLASSQVTLYPSAPAKLPLRLQSLYVTTRQIIEQWSPIAVAVETPIQWENGRAGGDTVGAGYGAVLAAIGSFSVPVIRFIGVNPTHTKMGLSGNHRASKEQQVSAARHQFNKAVGEDEADAIGVALWARSEMIQEGIAASADSALRQAGFPEALIKARGNAAPKAKRRRRVAR